MSRSLDHWLVIADFTSGHNELGSIDEMPTSVALVASRILVFTPWTCSLDESIGQKLVTFLAEKLVDALRQNVSFGFYSQKQRLNDSVNQKTNVANIVVKINK